MEERQFSACMERMCSGDRDALHEVYGAYVSYIYSIVVQIVPRREDAEDVTSEFFIRLWKIAATYRGGSGHRAWMAAVARNMAIDLMRKMRREVLTEEPADQVMAQGGIEQEVIADMSLEQALARLKPKEREVVDLKIMGELTFREIAAVLKIPIGTVTWRYQNAIRKLRRCGYE